MGDDKRKTGQKNPVKVSGHFGGGFRASLGRVNAFGDTEAQAKRTLMNNLDTLLTNHREPVIVPRDEKSFYMAYAGLAGWVVEVVLTDTVAPAGAKELIPGTCRTLNEGTYPASWSIGRLVEHLVGQAAKRATRERALKRAEEIGAEWGKTAAGWHFGSETSPKEYEATLKGIGDNDPAIVDTFPTWNHNADENGSKDLAKQLESGGFEVGFDIEAAEKDGDWSQLYESFFMESAMNYCQDGFSAAVSDEIARTCRYQLED